MATPDDPIDPIAAAAVTNNDVRGLPPYPSLQRITRTDAVGVAAANKQHKAIERRTDTLLERLNALITAHNLNASSATSYFLKRIGGALNAMQGILHMGDNKITDLGEASGGADAPRADQTLTSLGLNSGNLDANGKKITDLADGVLATDAANLGQVYAISSGAGEVFATRSAVTVVGVSVSGTAPGPYTFVVPAGVANISVDIVGGGAGAGNGSTGNGSSSTVSGSVSGTLVTANGGNSNGTGGAVSGFCAAGGNGGSGKGGVCPNQYGQFYGNLAAGMPDIGGFGGGPGQGNGATSIANATGYGNGGSNSDSAAYGGGAAAGSGIVSVTPGETLTITVGAGGDGLGTYANGSPGMVRIRF